MENAKHVKMVWSLMERNAPKKLPKLADLIKFLQMENVSVLKDSMISTESALNALLILPGMENIVNVLAILKFGAWDSLLLIQKAQTVNVRAVILK